MPLKTVPIPPSPIFSGYLVVANDVTNHAGISTSRVSRTAVVSELPALVDAENSDRDIIISASFLGQCDQAVTGRIEIPGKHHSFDVVVLNEIVQTIRAQKKLISFPNRKRLLPR